MRVISTTDGLLRFTISISYHYKYRFTANHKFMIKDQSPISKTLQPSSSNPKSPNSEMTFETNVTHRPIPFGWNSSIDRALNRQWVLLSNWYYLLSCVFIVSFYISRRKWFSGFKKFGSFSSNMQLRISEMEMMS